MAYCKKCGAKLSNDSSFCQKCGAKIENKEQKKETPPHTNKKSYKWVWISVVVFAFLILFIAWGQGCESKKIECPPTCQKDGDACTKDYCDSSTNNQCVHEPIHPCPLPTEWGETKYGGYCNSDLDCQPMGGEMESGNCYNRGNEVYVQERGGCENRMCASQIRQVACCPNSCQGKKCDIEKGCY